MSADKSTKSLSKGVISLALSMAIVVGGMVIHRRWPQAVLPLAGLLIGVTMLFTAIALIRRWHDKNTR